MLWRQWWLLRRGIDQISLVWMRRKQIHRAWRLWKRWATNRGSLIRRIFRSLKSSRLLYGINRRKVILFDARSVYHILDKKRIWTRWRSVVLKRERESHAGGESSKIDRRLELNMCLLEKHGGASHGITTITSATSKKIAKNRLGVIDHCFPAQLANNFIKAKYLHNKKSSASLRSCGIFLKHRRKKKIVRRFFALWLLLFHKKKLALVNSIRNAQAGEQAVKKIRADLKGLEQQSKELSHKVVRQKKVVAAYKDKYESQQRLLDDLTASEQCLQSVHDLLTSKKNDLKAEIRDTREHVEKMKAKKKDLVGDESIYPNSLSAVREERKILDSTLVTTIIAEQKRVQVLHDQVEQQKGRLSLRKGSLTNLVHHFNELKIRQETQWREIQDYQAKLVNICKQMAEEARAVESKCDSFHEKIVQANKILRVCHSQEQTIRSLLDNFRLNHRLYGSNVPHLIDAGKALNNDSSQLTNIRSKLANKSQDASSLLLSPIVSSSFSFLTSQPPGSGNNKPFDVESKTKTDLSIRRGGYSGILIAIHFSYVNSIRECGRYSTATLSRD
eukprot:scaffold61_cov180-Ochromonas_danica.AAC.32